jgi:hypothetical protein
VVAVGLGGVGEGGAVVDVVRHAVVVRVGARDREPGRRHRGAHRGRGVEAPAGHGPAGELRLRSTVASSACLSSAAVSAGASARISASVPATSGAAIDVPSM